ncbi:MAG: methylamine utilization protein [Gammaproteobacteria bacterium]
MLKNSVILLVLLAGLYTGIALGAGLQVSVTDNDGKPVANAVVSLEPAAGTVLHDKTMLHAVMDQHHQEFVPHVLVVEQGTEVTFPNSDNIHHDVYSFSPAKTFELPLYKGKHAKPVLFDKSGVVVLGCNIHDWMLGYIDVVPTPWFVKTGNDGKAKLEAPAGKYTLVLWQPGLVAPGHQLSETLQLEIGKSMTRTFTVGISKPLVMSKRPTTTLQHESDDEKAPPFSD